MTKYREVDPSRLRTISHRDRSSNTTPGQFAQPPGTDRSFSAFMASLPDQLAGRTLRRIIDAVVQAYRRDRSTVLLIGGHIVKTGVGPLIGTLIARGVVDHIAMNGAAAIHDVELGLWQGTSETVVDGLIDGSFGMVEETGREMNRAIAEASKRGEGLGEGLTRLVGTEPEGSILASCLRHRVPVTVHPTIGGEIIHQHPSADGAALGDTAMRDFRRLSGALAGLHDGGVVLNLGSAVVLPEVFLKALAVARNLSEGRPSGFLAGNLDMLQHYRPLRNVVERPTAAGGEGVSLTGHHEILIPLLVWGIIETLEADRERPAPH